MEYMFFMLLPSSTKVIMWRKQEAHTQSLGCDFVTMYPPLTFAVCLHKTKISKGKQSWTPFTVSVKWHLLLNACCIIPGRPQHASFYLESWDCQWQLVPHPKLQRCHNSTPLKVSNHSWSYSPSKSYLFIYSLDVNAVIGSKSKEASLFIMSLHVLFLTNLGSLSQLFPILYCIIKTNIPLLFFCLWLFKNSFFVEFEGLNMHT